MDKYSAATNQITIPGVLSLIYKLYPETVLFMDSGLSFYAYTVKTMLYNWKYNLLVIREPMGKLYMWVVNEIFTPEQFKLKVKIKDHTLETGSLFIEYFVIYNIY